MSALNKTRSPSSSVDGQMLVSDTTESNDVEATLLLESINWSGTCFPSSSLAVSMTAFTVTLLLVSAANAKKKQCSLLVNANISLHQNVPNTGTGTSQLVVRKKHTLRWFAHVECKDDDDNDDDDDG